MFLRSQIATLEKWPRSGLSPSYVRPIMSTKIVATASIERSIQMVRGQRVLLDEALARLYGVSVKRLNQQVRRNASRFPGDFMFQLDEDEVASLRSQTATIKKGRGEHRKYSPMAFTEQGVAMLSSVLRSPRAVDVNVEIMRAFVRLRRLLESKRGHLPPARRPGANVRWSVSCRLRSHPRADDAYPEARQADRVSDQALRRGPA